MFHYDFSKNFSSRLSFDVVNGRPAPPPMQSSQDFDRFQSDVEHIKVYEDRLNLSRRLREFAVTQDNQPLDLEPRVGTVYLQHPTLPGSSGPWEGSMISSDNQLVARQDSGAKADYRWDGHRETLSVLDESYRGSLKIEVVNDVEQGKFLICEDFQKKE